MPRPEVTVKLRHQNCLGRVDTMSDTFDNRSCVVKNGLRINIPNYY